MTAPTQKRAWKHALSGTPGGLSVAVGNPQKFAAGKDRKQHVLVMLLVSVNTLSHLQSAETLVCLHGLAECLPNTSKQTS